MILNESIIESAFLRDLILKAVAPPDYVLEIGTGHVSTGVLVPLCERLGVAFRTVDASPFRARWAREQLRGKRNMIAVRARGEKFLRRFAGGVGFAYMDNYDWVDSAADTSGEYPPGLSKRESELVHLEQTFKLVERVRPEGLVLFDDTWFLERRAPGTRALREKVDFRTLSNQAILERYHVFGKGSLAVPFLLCVGFEVLAVSERPVSQQILLRRRAETVSEKDLPYDAEYFRALLKEHRLVRYGGGKERCRKILSALRDRAVLSARFLPARLRKRLEPLARALGLVR